MPRKIEPITTNRVQIEDTINKQLVMPKNVIRYQMQKIQVMIRRLDRVAVKQPAQVAIGPYLELLREFAKLAKELEDYDKARMVEKRGRAAEASVGEAAPDGELAGVSADNPFAG